MSDPTRTRFPIDERSDPLSPAGARRQRSQGAERDPGSILGSWRPIRRTDHAAELAGDGEAPAQAEAAPAGKTSPELSWVGFRVVDDATGDPIPGVALKVKLPNGEVRDFTTDAAGRIDVRDIQPGACTIEKMVDDRALEVVRVA